MRLSSLILAARAANARDRRSRYHNAFHHAGTTMIASPATRHEERAREDFGCHRPRRLAEFPEQFLVADVGQLYPSARAAGEDRGPDHLVAA
jgi:hypothetical protein